MISVDKQHAIEVIDVLKNNIKRQTKNLNGYHKVCEERFGNKIYRIKIGIQILDINNLPYIFEGGE